MPYHTIIGQLDIVALFKKRTDDDRIVADLVEQGAVLQISRGDEKEWCNGQMGGCL